MYGACEELLKSKIHEYMYMAQECMHGWYLGYIHSFTTRP
jgi:hypothetical protein